MSDGDFRMHAVTGGIVRVGVGQFFLRFTKSIISPQINYNPRPLAFGISQKPPFFDSQMRAQYHSFSPLLGKRHAKHLLTGQ